MGPGVCLGHRLGEDIVHIPFPQRLLEPLFAGGVDPLSHHHGIGGVHHRHGTGEQTSLLHLPDSRGLVRQPVGQQPDVLGGGAAAASRRPDSQLGIGFHLVQKALGVQTVFPGGGVRQTGVGLDEHQPSRGRGCAESPGHGQDLFRSQRAVDAQTVGPHTADTGGEGLHTAAGKGAAPFFKAHGDQHRQTAVFLGSQQSGPGFGQVGHGLDDDEVGLVGSRFDDGGELLHRLLKGQSARRLQQFSQRAYVQRHQRPEGGGGLPGDIQRRRHQLGRGIAGSLQFVGAGAEGVGVDHPGSGFQIGGVDPAQQLRLGDGQQLGAFPRLKAHGLQHGAHAAVQQDVAVPLKQFTDLHSVFPPCDSGRCPAAHSGRSLPDGP